MRYRVAGNSNTPIPLLEKLAIDIDTDKNMRYRVAGNSNTPIPLLEKLATDADSWVRKEVAGNSNTPTPLLEKLAHDTDKDVQSGVAWNSNTPIPLLEKLAIDKSKDVRSGVASNPNTPIPLLEKLALDKSKDVRKKVASNSKTPPSLRENFDRDYWLSGDIVTALFPLVEQIPLKQSVAIRQGVASNPHTPIPLLEKLATNANYDIIQAILNRITYSSKEIIESFPITPVLEQLCKSPQPSFHRLLAFLHPEAPVTALAKYFRSLAWVERYAIAQNPSTPDKTLTYLAKDANRVVRGAVKANQQKRAQSMLSVST